jgi:hypothetical protein
MLDGLHWESEQNMYYDLERPPEKQGGQVGRWERSAYLAAMQY